MTHNRLPHLLLAGWMLTASSAVMATGAELKQSQRLETEITTANANTQSRVSASSDKALDLEAQIEQRQAEVEGLEVYRDHLRGMLDSQQKEIASFDEQLSEIERTRESIVPLMYSMLDGLEAWVESDRPLRQEVRRERVAKLREMMTQSDVSDAEKYRRILEAYQIELDYGTKLGAYSAPIEVDGKSLVTEQLYLGRISLVARSVDRAHYWAWNASNEQWQALDSKAGLEIDKAFDVANKQAAPTLLHLPVSVKESQQ
ncbi:DUF3450 domain-containing protein [Vibrio scophthalmi]|uniref:DUF3450 domain-containing protein n=1 Tax=Vibrio scophthalmi TaxID=45658 RepID=UPI002FF0256B